MLYAVDINGCSSYARDTGSIENKQQQGPKIHNFNNAMAKLTNDHAPNFALALWKLSSTIRTQLFGKFIPKIQGNQNTMYGMPITIK